MGKVNKKNRFIIGALSNGAEKTAAKVFMEHVMGVDLAMPGGDISCTFEFKNGSSIKFKAIDAANIGRGSSPFVPHICQEDEFAFHKAAEKFNSNIIENGKHFSIKGKIKDGSIFIEEENMTNTNAPDDEYILFSSKKENDNGKSEK